MELKVGIQGYKQIIVKHKDTAVSYGSGSLEVFATPAMIALMENTAYTSIKDMLLKSDTTVGSEINVKHIKATAIGVKVICESILLKIESKKLLFKIKVSDEQGEIGTATHVRYIVDTEKFMAGLKL